jgi:capsular polysaccharide biosynthesis protein
MIMFAKFSSARACARTTSLKEENSMINVTPEPVMRIAMGFMAAKHLFTASAIALFEALAAGPASLEEIAQKTDVPFRTLGIIAAAADEWLRQDRWRDRSPRLADLTGQWM